MASYDDRNRPARGARALGDRYENDRRSERDREPDDRRDDRARYADGSYRDDERGFVDRATDEVRSWFGDDDAERRRARDERADRDYDARDYDRRERAGDYSRFAERRRRADEDGTTGFRGYAEGGTFTGRRAGSGNDFGRGFISDESDSRYDGGRSGYGRSFHRTADGFGPDPGRGSDGTTRGSGARTGAQPQDDGRGPHRGRGPQGYSRSPERIAEDVNEALMDDDHVDATNIRVSVEDGEVTLAGTVESRYEKRAAEQIAEHVRGVRDVHNGLRVQNGTTTVGTSGAGAEGVHPAPSGGGSTAAPTNPRSATAGASVFPAAQGDAAHPATGAGTSGETARGAS